MKKITLMLAAAAILAFSSFGVSAYTPDENGRYTITYNVGVENAGAMYGLAAISGTGSEVSTTEENSLVYLYQATADAEGNITFAGFAPMGPEAYEPDYVESTVFIGGPGYSTAKQIGVLEASGSTTEKQYTVSGAASDTVNATDTATVSVYDESGEVVYFSEVNSDGSGSFSFVVPAGTYSIKFTKPGFCSYTYTNVAVEADVTLPTVDMTALAGDIVANGQVNINDLSALLADYNKSSENLTNANSDLNQNGQVNITDLSALLGGYNSSDVTVTYTAK